jgi:hypothetical protein
MPLLPESLDNELSQQEVNSINNQLLAMPNSEVKSLNKEPLVVVNSRRSENILVIRGAPIKFDEVDDDSPTHIKRLDTV